MKLGVILAIGESFDDFKEKGQDKLLVESNIKTYLKNFNSVYIFSYKNEAYKLPKGASLIVNKFNLHRFMYSIIMPVTSRDVIKKCDILRGLQVTGGIPCFIAKMLYKKPYVINYGYDYSGVAMIEKKYLQSLFFRIVTLLVIKFADAVIVTAPFLEKQIKKYKQKNIYLIPNGIDVQKFSPMHKKKTGKPRLIFVGRLETQNLGDFVFVPLRGEYGQN